MAVVAISTAAIPPKSKHFAHVSERSTSDTSRSSEFHTKAPGIFGVKDNGNSISYPLFWWQSKKRAAKRIGLACLFICPGGQNTPSTRQLRGIYMSLYHGGNYSPLAFSPVSSPVLDDDDTNLQDHSYTTHNKKYLK
jgi:hypothetical protein